MGAVTEQAGFAVMAMWIYPVKGEPGVPLSTAEAEAEGLRGDRRKKAALHLVSAADAAELEARANLVLDATAGQIFGLVGSGSLSAAPGSRSPAGARTARGSTHWWSRPGVISVGDRLETMGR